MWQRPLSNIPSESMQAQTPTTQPTAASHKIISQLEAARKDLLDLSLRNRLLNYKPLKSQGVTIVDELSAELFRLLVSESKTMTFLPKPEPTKAEAAETANLAIEPTAVEPVEPMPPPTDPFADIGPLLDVDPVDLQRDNKLQTSHPDAELQRRLLNTYHTARTYIQEQGVNVLYLALGFLEWYEAEAPDKARYAPLILLPVELQRTSVRAPFRLRYTDDELGENLSLQAKLKSELGLDLPQLASSDENGTDLNLDSYFAKVAKLVQGQKGWAVRPNEVALGFFSFGTFLMFNDLDHLVWDAEQLSHHPLMGALLGNGSLQNQSQALPHLDEESFIDKHLRPQDSHQVVDADSSQISAILAVNHGQNLVIEGPPGTGKSQTITNIIAEAIGSGKKVLFVAEKMAALEVVKRRLDLVGLGDACLELHSHKKNKKEVLQELKRTFEAGKPAEPNGRYDYQTLAEKQQALNDYSQLVNLPIGQSGVSPYMAYGRLIQLAKPLTDHNAPDVSLEQPTSWSPVEWERRLSLVKELEQLLRTAVPLTQHPFWGSQARQTTAAQNRRLANDAKQLLDRLTAVVQLTQQLSQQLNVAEATHLSHVKLIWQTAQQITAAPDLTGIDPQDPQWAKQAQLMTEIVAQGARAHALRQQYQQQLLPEAWQQEMLPLRQTYLAWGPKWYRFLSGEFKQAKQRLASLCQQELPASIAEQQALIDAILEEQRCERSLTEENGRLSQLFGHHWQGLASDWAHLTAVAHWIADSYTAINDGRVLKTTLRSATSPAIQQHLPSQQAQLGSLLTEIEAQFAALLTAAQIDEPLRQQHGRGIGAMSLAQQSELLQQWGTNPDQIDTIISYNNLTDQLQTMGLQDVGQTAVSWPAAPHHLTHIVERAWYEALIDTAFKGSLALSGFSSSSHEQKIETFRQFDQRLFELNRQQLQLTHWQQKPHSATELGILKREFEKKTRHRPIRDLILQEGKAIQRLKPVFMMGPQSIAMYLPPQAIDFDLVIFDEASQVRPVDAFGAILRGKQAVVVGDSRQLPPTSFFDKMNEEDELEETSTSDLESILGLFKTRDAVERMLRWHYRSRHESLIAVSNAEFYENRLVVFPSPAYQDSELGLVYHHLPETAYDRGKSRSNVLEATAVAQAVMAHARQHPNQSLGVAAFSTEQMRTIQLQVELLRRQDPSCEPFFSDHATEPFFVKNLENVQGDERDVIFISVGYGYDDKRHLTMNFGPLNKDGGERRLNVLITRAKVRCELFTNLQASDIVTSKTSGGVAALKQFLHYAENRQVMEPSTHGREASALFETAVAEAVRQLGYEVSHQVGSAGFFIDIAIKDPHDPGRYLLGIQCDGPTYHSARSARDRDRLRQQVLAGLGWQMHRVWSTAWFKNPQYELDKLQKAIQTAVEPRP